MFAVIASAIFLGAHLKARAPAMAMLAAQSPCDRSAGTSSVNAGSGASGSVPA